MAVAAVKEYVGERKDVAANLPPGTQLVYIGWLDHLMFCAPFAFPLAGAPPGSYTWLAGVTTPGTLTLVAPVASTTFSITP